MIDFEAEMKTILATDPLGLLNVKPKQSATMRADDRLVTSFEEINSFVREHGHEPTENRDISERRLYSRLKGLRENPAKAAALLEFDSCKLLAGIDVPSPKQIETIADVLEDDALGLLGDSGPETEDPNSIFRLSNVPAPKTPPDLIAQRKPCDEFDQFEPLFKQWQGELKSGAKVTVPFKSEKRIVPDRIFLLQGMLVYVANRGKWEKGAGKANARLYCVFENGTESNMLLRSLAAALWKDEGSREVIPSDQVEMFNSVNGSATSEDEATGHIYVLRSLSQDPTIRDVQNLYKIGFSSQPIAKRIQNAANDPTFLMADVISVVEFETYNLNPQKLELLLHKFLAEVCIDVDVYDTAGKRHTPREWFVVPLAVVKVAIQLMINGEILNYRYDSERLEIVAK